MTGYKNKAHRLTVKYDMTGKKEDFEKADAEYVKLLESDKADKTDYSDYARLNIYHSDALVKKAEELLNQAISLGDEGAGHQMITLLSKQGRNHESIEKHKAQTERNPENVKNWHRLIHAYYPIGSNFTVNGNLDKAFETAEHALQKFPKDAFLLCLRGFISKGMGNCDEALAYWHKSMSADPQIMDNYSALAYTYQDLGRYSEAITTWEKLIAFYEKEGYPEHITRPEREIAKLKMLL